MFSKRLGRKNIIVVSIAVVEETILLATLTNLFSYIFILFFLSGLGMGAYSPSAISFLSDIFPPDKRGRYIALHETAFTTASTIGLMFVSLTLLLGAGWRESIKIWLAVIIILALQLVLVREQAGQPISEDQLSNRSIKKSIILVLGHERVLYFSKLHIHSELLLLQ